MGRGRAGNGESRGIPRRTYTLVITNVPYLGRGKSDLRTAEHRGDHYREAQVDLATAFVIAYACDSLQSGWQRRSVTASELAVPDDLQETTRESALKSNWRLVARLGPGAFETISGEVVNVAASCAVSQGPNLSRHVRYRCVDAQTGRQGKASARDGGG